MSTLQNMMGNARSTIIRALAAIGVNMHWNTTRSNGPMVRIILTTCIKPITLIGIFIGILILLSAGIGVASACETYVLVNPGESIQDAIDSLCPEGGVVELAEGTFNISAPTKGEGGIWIQKSNVTLRGAGRDKTTINALQKMHLIIVSPVDDIEQDIWDNMASCLPLGDCTLINVTIEKMHLHGSTKDTTGFFDNYGILSTRTRNSTYSDLWIDNFGSAMSPWCSYYMTIENNLLENNYYNWDAGCIRYSAIQNNTIRSTIGNNCKFNGACSNNNINNNTFGPSINDGLYIYGASNNNEIADNVMQSNSLSGINIFYSYNNIVQDNLIKNNEEKGIKITSSTGSSRNINNTITGNIIYGGSGTWGDGIFVNEQTGIDGGKINIIGNTIYGNSRHGINVVRGDFIIKNNVVTNNSGYGIKYTDIAIDLSYNDVWNNALGNYSGCSAGTGCISGDPLFIDPTNGDFHLKSTAGRWTGAAWAKDSEDSLCIDAGDPDSNYDNEPSPNGSRVNLGAYGNTAEASKSSGEDTTPPTIIARSPTGTNVPIGTTISVTFNEAMNQTSAQNAFSISVSGSFSWNGNNMIFTPSSNLNYGTTYTVNINTEAEDLSGNNLESSYSWQFTTMEEDAIPPVISNVATSGVTSSSATITWQTDEPANSLVKYGTTSGIYIENKSDSSYVISHSITLTGLTSNTTYYFAVNSTDQAGNSAQSSELNFTTPATSSIVYVATDGTGDYNCDGIDDHVKINQAISYINSIGGGTVHLKAGIFIINDAINLCSNLTFESDGEDSTIIKLRDQNNREFWGLFTGTGISNTTIQNFTLDGNWGGQTGIVINSDVDAFRIYNSGYIIFQYVTCKDFSTDHFEFSQSSDCVVANCTSLDSGHDASRAMHCERITFSDNYVWNVGNTGVRIYDSNDCVVERNRYYTRGFGILVNTEGSGTYGNNIYMDNYMLNWLSGGPCPGIRIHAEGNTIIDNEFLSGNIIYHSELEGFELIVTNSGQIRNIEIINNVVQDSTKGIYLEEGTNIIAKNNILVNNREYGIYGNVISSYNDVWNNPSGNYGGGASAGTGDISVDPLFVDPESEDFHLKSTAGRWNGIAWITDSEDSPCIDAGDPSSDYGNEPEPNGSRINMGAYGNTTEASKSGGIPDTTPPEITDIQATPITTTHATIKWDTDENADTNITYDTNPANLRTTWHNRSELTTSHSTTLTNLKENTTYYFRVYSTDASGNTGHSDIRDFTTQRVLPGNSTVTIQDMHANRLKEGVPDTIFHDYEYIDLGRIGTIGNYRHVLWFDLSQFNSTDRIDSATLSLFWEDESRDQSTTVQIYQPVEWYSDCNWNDKTNGIAWDNPGGDWFDRDNTAQGDVAFASVTFPADTTPARAYYDFDVTEIVQSYVDGDSDNTGFFIRATEADNTYISFYGVGWDIANERPKLTISYSWGAPPENRPPTLASIGDQSAIHTATTSFPVTASDPDNDPLNFTAQNLPPGAHFNASNRTFIWTPTYENVSWYRNIRFEVSDGQLTDSEEITIYPRWDVDRNGIVNDVDRSLIAAHFEGPVSACEDCDVNLDSEINIIDYSLAGQHIDENWGAGIGATPVTGVTISPESRTVAPGESFSVNISVTPDTGIAGMQFDLVFNASLVRVNSVLEGDLLNQNGTDTAFVNGTVDNTAGTITNVFGCILGPYNVTAPGTFAIINMTAKGPSGTSNLDLADVIVSDPYGYATDVELAGGTVTVNEGTSPVLTDPGATPPIIPDDTDNDPGWGETSQLNITVTDDDGIAGVTIDLSPIGGSPAQAMNHIGGNIWSVTTNASNGTAGFNGTAYTPHFLQITATDIHGNSNTSAGISLMVVRNGDVNSDGKLDYFDVVHLIRYLRGVTGFDVTEGIADVTGDGVVNDYDVTYLANHIYGAAGYEILH